jgi:two-component system, response regulator RegA
MSERVVPSDDRTLLLVDDDELWLKRLARAMEKRGYEVATAAGVREGVALARAQ